VRGATLSGNLCIYLVCVQVGLCLTGPEAGDYLSLHWGALHEKVTEIGCGKCSAVVQASGVVAYATTV
jgi:hypothetical protein